jgi:hypothetical protein
MFFKLRGLAHMKWFLWTMTLILIAGSITFAQEPALKPETQAASLPTVDQVLDKYVAAVGGREAIEKITSREVKGTYEISPVGLIGTMTMLQKAPDKTLTVMEIPGFGAVQSGFDGNILWSQNPAAGLAEISGAARVAAKREAEFYQELKLKDMFKKLVVTGKQQIGGKDAYAVEATPEEGKAETYFFDTESGLLVRHDAERESEQGAAMSEYYYEDYKNVDGVKFPYTVRMVNPTMTVVMKFSEVKNNVEIEDLKFAKPAAQ